MIYVAMLVREAIFIHGTSKQGINVKTGHFEVTGRENKKHAG